MRDEAAEAIRLPLSFWRAAAVQQALHQRDIGGLFREAGARGISQTRIGSAAGFSQGRVSEIVRGTWRVSRLNVLERIADGLSMPERERELLGLAPRHRAEVPRREVEHGGDGTGDDVERKEFLRVALGAGAGIAAARYISMDDHASSDLRSALAGPIAHYRRMEHAVSSEHLAPAVEAHLSLGASDGGSESSNQRRLQRAAEIAGMTAWLAIDRGEPAAARARYNEAIRRAEQADHPLLMAYMVASLGQFETESGNPRIGLQHIARAEALLGRSAPDAARAWLSSVRAVTAGKLQDQKATLAALKLSDTLTDHPKGEPVWPWVFQFDRGKLASARAVALGRLGDIEGARTAFGEADPHLTGPKPRALGLIDHARVLVAAGRIDEGCVAVEAALRTGQRLDSRRIVNQVELFIQNMPPGGSEARSLTRLKEEG
jgi:transcriptional regulator with XRE-family HTH domain